VKRACLIAACVCLLAAPSSAQTTTPAWDFSGSYSLLRDLDVDENFHGWLIGAGANLSPIFAVVGELGGNYKSFDEGIVDVSLSVHSFLGGVRVQSRDNAQFTPYGQLLLGAARGTIDVEGDSDSETDFALQPGAGVDWWLQPNAGVRVGVDYRQIFSEGDDLSQFRFHVGIVLTGGR
jgi:opacity protein-like surface antigen